MATAPTVSPSTYTPTSRDWRGQLGARLVEPDEAVSHIKSGDRVVVSIAQATPSDGVHRALRPADGN